MDPPTDTPLGDQADPERKSSATDCLLALTLASRLPFFNSHGLGNRAGPGRVGGLAARISLTALRGQQVAKAEIVGQIEQRHQMARVGFGLHAGKPPLLYFPPVGDSRSNASGNALPTGGAA